MLELSRFPTVVIGDLHGAMTPLVEALQACGLIDAHHRWAGGRRRLVQLGDVHGRGTHSLALMDLLRRLQHEARAAGGEVVCLVGNNEFVALRAGAGDHNARAHWSYFGGVDAIHREWLARTGQPWHTDDPPYAEAFYDLFAPDGPFGGWMRTHRLACRVGDYAVVHAGWTPACPDSVEAMNAAWDGAPREPGAYLAAWSRSGPLAPCRDVMWVRGQPDADVAAACRRLGCRGLIAGHTIFPGIRVSAGARLIQIDVGMYQHGTWAALGLDDGGQPWALLPGRPPAPIAADGLIPLPTAAPRPGAGRPAPNGVPDRTAGCEPDGAPDHAPPRFQPGQLVRLYQTRDAAWRQYILILAPDRFKNEPAYAGRVITHSTGRWTARRETLPGPAVDRFGRAVPLDEVPPDLRSG